MPAIPSVDAHADIPFRTHHWHARQSVSIPFPTSSISTSSSTTSFPTYIIPIFVVVFVIALLVAIVRYAKKAQHSSHVAPRPVVEAPPGSRHGPVIAEILANSQAASGAVAQDEGSRDMYGAVSRSAPIDDPPQSIDEPSQPPQTNDPLSVNEDNRGSRASLDASVGQVSERPAVIIHQDGGHLPQVDEAEPIELPPPYVSIPLA